MSLSNAQYDSILHIYEQRRLASRHQHEERLHEIYSKIPAYEDIDYLVSSISVTQGKKNLMGDSNALSELSDIYDDLRNRRQLLLTAAGYSVNYLEPTYVCEKCKDTGYIGSEKCSCFKQAMLDLLYEQSNIHEVLKAENFNTLSDDFYEGDDLNRFHRAVEQAKDFIKTFDSDYRNLFFYGTVGTGKSFLSNCIANELLSSGHSVIYFSAITLFERISDYTFQKSGRDSSSSPFDDIYDCDLLIIDDLGTEFTNNFVTTQLFSCLNERNIRHKSTVISTNLDFEDFKERYSDRIFSRVASTYELIKLSGKDIRMYKKRLQYRK